MAFEQECNELMEKHGVVAYLAFLVDAEGKYRVGGNLTGETHSKLSAVLPDVFHHDLALAVMFLQAITIALAPLAEGQMKVKS